MGRAVIISGGEIADYSLTAEWIDENDCIICADSGIVHCDKMNLKADIWVGDFDSCKFSEYANCGAAQGSEIIKLIPEKNDTDTEFACMYAYEKGFDELLLIGGGGTRADHSLSNVFLLEKMLDLSVKMVIADEHNRIHIVRNSSIRIQKNRFKYISIIPISRVLNGVSNIGFKYPLHDEALYRCESRGVSNELLDEYGEITVKDGTALVTESVD